MKFLDQGKKLYWGLVFTFAALYLAVAAVSTIHAISFFQLSNVFWLAILLGVAYEVGQATVLFSILMTENKNKFMPWVMMIMLTALQISANVYASFKFMDTHGADWEYWKRAILFSLKEASPETNKIVISWISGALLPLVALGMTSLIAENIRIMTGEADEDTEDDEELEYDEGENVLENVSEETELDNGWISKEKAEEIINNEVKRRLEEASKPETTLDQSILEKIVSEYKKLDEVNKTPLPPGLNLKTSIEEIHPPIQVDLQRNINVVDPNTLVNDNYEKDIEESSLSESVGEKDSSSLLPTKEEIESINDGVDEIIFKNGKKEENTQAPVNKMRGWHLMKEYIDDENNVFEKGKFIKKDPDKEPTSKKA